MYFPASPFPLGRPVLSVQLLGTSAFLQLSGLAWATLAAQEQQPARAPVPWCPSTQSCPCPLPVGMGCARSIQGVWVRETPQTPNSFSLFLFVLDFVSFNI